MIYSNAIDVREYMFGEMAGVQLDDTSPWQDTGECVPNEEGSWLGGEVQGGVVTGPGGQALANALRSKRVNSGAANHIAAPYPTQLDLSKPFGVSFWMNREELINMSGGIVRLQDSEGRWFSLDGNPNTRQARCMLDLTGDGNTDHAARSNVPSNDFFSDGWHHYAFCWDGGGSSLGFSFYKDAALVSRTGPGTDDNSIGTTGMRIGEHTSSGFCELSRLRFQQGVMSNPDIAAQYQFDVYGIYPWQDEQIADVASLTLTENIKGLVAKARMEKAANASLNSLGLGSRIVPSAVRKSSSGKATVFAREEDDPNQ